jgi:hypothetical protein
MEVWRLREKMKIEQIVVSEFFHSFRFLGVYKNFLTYLSHPRSIKCFSEGKLFSVSFLGSVFVRGLAK